MVDRKVIGMIVLAFLIGGVIGYLIPTKFMPQKEKFGCCSCNCPRGCPCGCQSWFDDETDDETDEEDVMVQDPYTDSFYVEEVYKPEK